MRITTYITGYALSILCTLLAFGLLKWHIATQHFFPSHTALTLGFISLALMQLVVQLFFFLHVGRGRDRHWNAVALCFALFIVTVLVGGTLWIMQNLQHGQMQNNFIDNNITAQNSND